MVEATKYGIVVLKLQDEDGGGYAAFATDLPGCMSDGETREEALANVQIAIDDWIETARELGRSIPEPGSAVKKHHRQMELLYDAVKALSEFATERDAKATSLERRLAELLAVLKDEKGRVPSEYAFLTAEKSEKGKIH